MTQTSMLVPQSLPIREGLARECKQAWQRLASPGTWWTAQERLARSAKAATPKAGAVKPSAKITQKAPAKKKAPAKATGAR